MSREPDAHVAVAPLRHDADLEVVQAAGRGDRVRGPHTRCVLMSLAMTWKVTDNLINQQLEVYIEKVGGYADFIISILKELVIASVFLSRC